MKPIKQLKIKVFTVGNQSAKTSWIKAPGGRIFTPEGIEHTLQRFASEIQTSFPFEEFSLKQLSRNEFNFVWVRNRPVEEGELRAGGMALGEIVTVEVGTSNSVLVVDA